MDTLFALQRAQADRIPYEFTWIWLGERRTIRPLDSVRYLAGGRGGYCYHHNGALATLLGWLGFTVFWHVGGVQNHPDAKANVGGNHLPLTVTNLPDETNPEGAWFVDLGLGDGPNEPMRLRTGTYHQGPHTYRLRPSEITPDGWRFDADPSMSLHGMDFLSTKATPTDLEAEHERLQTSPDSSFMKTLAVFRRPATGVDFLRGRALKLADGSTRDLHTQTDWYACLADQFNLSLSDVDPSRKKALWEKVSRAHERWLASA